jgi:hypothetical protein
MHLPPPGYDASSPQKARDASSCATRCDKLPGCCGLALSYPWAGKLGGLVSERFIQIIAVALGALSVALVAAVLFVL